jgi:hypothetical protein
MNLMNETKQGSVLRQVAALDKMTEQQLREQWRTLFGTEAPNYRPSVMARRLAHRIQELTFGGLSAQTRARMMEMRQNLGLIGPAAPARACKRRADMPVAGTRLIREWDGQRHEVNVTREGFEYEGRLYRSLSAIANAITGTHWNGKLFFGLAKPKKNKRSM